MSLADHTLSKHATGRPFAKVASRLFTFSCMFCMWICLGALAWLLWNIFSMGWDRVSLSFLSTPPSQISPEKAGIQSALFGSIYLIGLTALLSVPIGVGTAIYLEEYAPANRWRTLVQTNIANLAGVPSIVFGILGLGLFVRTMGLGRSVMAGALTLTLVVLPILILSAQEALRAVPSTIRQASYALGATRWQTVWYQILPASLPGILTGIILALSRALGEAAPLVAIGAATYVRNAPNNLFKDDFSALPLQIYNWTDQSQEAFHVAAAGAIVVLLTVLIGMNALAVLLRYRFSRKVQW